MAEIRTTPDPAPLDYERGEFWAHGWDKDGKPLSAPVLIQRKGETHDEFVARVRATEELANG